MTKTKLSVFDSAHYLETEEDIIEYLQAVFEEPITPNLIARALGTIARARNFTALAKQIGMSRQGLIKALSGEGNPSFDTLAKVAGALGYHFVLEPSPAADKDKTLAPAA